LVNQLHNYMKLSKKLSFNYPFHIFILILIWSDLFASSIASFTQNHWLHLFVQLLYWNDAQLSTPRVRPAWQLRPTTSPCVTSGDDVIDYKMHCTLESHIAQQPPRSKIRLSSPSNRRLFREDTRPTQISLSSLVAVHWHSHSNRILTSNGELVTTT